MPNTIIITSQTPSTAASSRGDTASSVPSSVATPLPPRNLSQTGKQWPITAANAAVAADGAAFVIVSDRPLGPNPLRIMAGLTRGADPAEPGLAPAEAIAQALSAADIAPSKLRMAGVMEAYAAQAMACVAASALDAAIVNPDGGALARGHPIGASGAILAVRLFHGLAAGHGLAAIAAAGGLGTALVVVILYGREFRSDVLQVLRD